MKKKNCLKGNLTAMIQKEIKEFIFLSHNCNFTSYNKNMQYGYRAI